MLIKLLCFSIPILAGVQFNVAGGLFAAELILPCIALVLLLKRKISRLDRNFQVILQVGLTYLAAQIASDLWNGTSYDQYSRGWARISVFLVNFASIYILINNRRSHLLLFTLGFAVGRIWLTYSGMDGDTIPWKLGLAKPVTLIVLLLCVTLPILREKRKFLVPIILLGFGLLNIIMDFRSLGAVLLITSMLIVFSGIGVNRKTWQRRPRAGAIFAPAFAGLVAIVGAYQFYAYAAQSGWLSERATGKFEAQTSETDLPILIAGRSEIFAFIEAILDSPVIGHGSWPKDPRYADRLAAERYHWGLSKSATRPNDDSIPIHSHLFGSWVESGIMGGMFWSLILYLVAHSLLRAHQGQSHMKPLYVFGSVLLIWDVLFSPFSGFRRLETAFLIVIVLRSLLQRIPSRQRSRRQPQGRRQPRRKKRCQGHGAKDEPAPTVFAP